MLQTHFLPPASSKGAGRGNVFGLLIFGQYYYLSQHFLKFYFFSKLFQVGST